MSTDKKIELAVSIVKSVLENSAAGYDRRLEDAPKYIESIYKKIDELSKNSNKIPDSSNHSESIKVI